MRQRYLSLLLAGMLWFGPFRGFTVADNDSKALEFFEAKIRPVLVQSCYECHSAKAVKLKGGLLLDSRDGIRKGGDSGPAVVPGAPEESLLIQALRYQGMKMPPKGKLADDVIADFTRWVKIGAPDPRTGTATAPVKQSPDKGKNLWSLQPVRQPAIPAVKDAAWPRSPVDRFILSRLEAEKLQPSRDADPHVLLRRIHYVLTGLPPTRGQLEKYQKSAIRNPQSAIAEVVDEQLASPHFGERWARHWLDLARYADVSGSTAPAPYTEAWRYRDYVIHAFNTHKSFERMLREQLAGDLLPAATPEEKAAGQIATGFLALSHLVAADRDPEKRKLDVIDEQLEVIGKAFLGLSLGCARCHDHKLDPVPTRDYYALAGIFRSTNTLKGGGFGTIDPGAVAIGKISPAAPAWLRGENVKVIGAEDDKKPRDEPIHIRGEVDNKGSIVPRGFLTSIAIRETPLIPAHQSGRLQLADWLLSPDNPLVARVIVNRVWHQLFGQGLVRSTDNFGSTGDFPSHPELLDYLALRFREEHRWSFKSLIRELLLTRVWQLSAQADAPALATDPDNRLLGRANRRRQDAEALHDSLFFVAGRLDLEPPTYTVPPDFKGAGNQGSTLNLAIAEDTLRKRAVYWPVFRKDVPVVLDMLSIFDMPVASSPRGNRAVTVVPTQALFLLNSPMLRGNAEALAAKVRGDSQTDQARIEQVYLRLYARKPTIGESERALRFLAAWAERDTAWTRLCHTLLIANEFLVIE
jgi:hypothetical protein